MPLDSRSFRDTMGHLAGAVSVVTVKDSAGALGMTANSVTSLSLEPPLLLVCVDRSAVIADLIERAELFGVNFLASDQEQTARRYADRERARVDGGRPLSPGGLPLIEGALAHIDCRRAAVLPGGDHLIITGSPEWSATRDGPALLFFRHNYGASG